MKLLIVPDTNVFMNRLDIIESYMNDNQPFNTHILILRIVLDELDYNKKTMPRAQKAIIFIQKNQRNSFLQIEGEVCENGMDVILEYPDMRKLKTNDDKIVRISSSLQYSVLLTSDRNMLLKARAENVKCVYVANKMYTDINLEVLMARTCVEPMEMSDNIPEYSYIEEATEILRYVAIKLLMDAYGAGYTIRYEDKVRKGNLIQLLEIIIEDYYLVCEYLHTSSKNILVNIKDTLKKEKDEEARRKAVKNIFTLFRINKDI